MEEIIKRLVSLNTRIANNFKSEEGFELRKDLFDITQELYKIKSENYIYPKPKYNICDCGIPEPIGKCSENGIESYCKKCLKEYKQITK